MRCLSGAAAPPGGAVDMLGLAGLTAQETSGGGRQKRKWATRAAEIGEGADASSLSTSLDQRQHLLKSAPGAAALVPGHANAHAPSPFKRKDISQMD